MRQILHDYGVNDYDILTLAKTVRTADGVPVRLSEHYTAPAEQNLADIDAGITPRRKAPEEATDYAGMSVDVSSDKLTVTVHFDIMKGTRVPTPKMIKDALKDWHQRLGHREGLEIARTVRRGKGHGTRSRQGCLPG
ncbi:hypothetical protein [uncultured Selenomonas sp.]|uniref:hypothetical protein n=1 Tax=uncultured Selenomonas sp. TaxID=159275 RepID=UPI0025D8A84E|nr:hypothetical protein [uncultured Selenomonas sp.]